MLALKRKIGEGVALGDDVRIVVIAIEGDRVTLGVEAPADVRIQRVSGAARPGAQGA